MSVEESEKLNVGAILRKLQKEIEYLNRFSESNDISLVKDVLNRFAYAIPPNPVSNTVPPLNPNVLEIIFGFLEGSLTQKFHHVSLVCKSWLAVSQTFFKDHLMRVHKLLHPYKTQIDEILPDKTNSWRREYFRQGFVEIHPVYGNYKATNDKLAIGSIHGENCVYVGRKVKGNFVIQCEIEFSEWSGEPGRHGGIQFLSAERKDRWAGNTFVVDWIDRRSDYGYRINGQPANSSEKRKGPGKTWRIVVENGRAVFSVDNQDVYTFKSLTRKEGYIALWSYPNCNMAVSNFICIRI